MKKVVYSGFLKFIAVILFISSIVAGVLVVTDGMVEFDREELEIYSFETEFEKSWIMSSLLYYPEEVVYSVYEQFFYERDEYGRYVNRVDDASVDNALFEERLEEALSYDYYADRIRYYVKWDDIELTNCGAKDPTELMNGTFYSYFKHDGLGQTERESSVENSHMRYYSLDYITGGHAIIVACSVNEDIVTEYRAIWENQQRIVINTVVNALVCVACALISAIYLVSVCGKNKNGEYKSMWIDNIWLEVHLAAIAVFSVYSIAIGHVVLDEYVHGDFPINLVYLIFGALSGIASAGILTSLLSIIRNIKCRRLIETSVILQIIGWCIRLFVKIVKCIAKGIKEFFGIIVRAMSKKTGLLLIGILFVYTAIIGIFGVLTIITPIWIIIGVVLFLAACFVIGRRARDFDEIKKGVAAVRGGNVSYKIPEPGFSDMKDLAANINDIARGLDESVAAKVKAERLKSELITNVSHDLKTPITSIINYTELLSKIDGLPEEARDYVAVIAKKSDRLKKLTQDLFDISKVQSGNEDLFFERLDVALLINQALGEYDNEIMDSGLVFCLNATKELYISADGGKMSRVMSNLISNILKYSMKNTRVFINAYDRGGEAVIEFKNISAYPLNFDANEITHRFVRGDESRTTEGNGLGLAIAKSYTEACGGTFEIVVDGDMFKAILKMKKLG